MSTTDMTFDEAMDTLTGYDELAIKQATDETLSGLLRSDELRAMRSVIAVLIHRDNGGQGPAKFKDAYGSAMQMTLKQVRTYFAKDDEVMPSEPDTDAGKDDSPSEKPTTT